MKLILQDNIKGRTIYKKVIPTVCKLESLLLDLQNNEFDIKKIKKWKISSYRAYGIDNIRVELQSHATLDEQKEIIKNHILNTDKMKLGAHVIDIYLVAYVAENFGAGKRIFLDFVLQSGITEKKKSAENIWSVGKPDGVFLNILNADGTVKDWKFLERWIE